MALRLNALLCRQTPAVFLEETFPVSLDSLQPVHLLNVAFTTFRAFDNRFISSTTINYPCELSKAIFLGFSMLSEKHVHFDVAHPMHGVVRRHILWSKMWGHRAPPEGTAILHTVIL